MTSPAGLMFQHLGACLLAVIQFQRLPQNTCDCNPQMICEEKCLSMLGSQQFVLLLFLLFLIFFLISFTEEQFTNNKIHKLQVYISASLDRCIHLCNYRLSQCAEYFYLLSPQRVPLYPISVILLSVPHTLSLR